MLTDTQSRDEARETVAAFVERIRAKIGHLPETSQGALMRYLEHGVRPGSFIEAILTNNLYKALAYADSVNKDLLQEHAYAVVRHFPNESCGSRESFVNWMRENGLRGMLSKKSGG